MPLVGKITKLGEGTALSRTFSCLRLENPVKSIRKEVHRNKTDEHSSFSSHEKPIPFFHSKERRR
jgi:hypothetical protein